MYRDLKIRKARRNDGNSIVALAAQLSTYENNRSIFSKKDYFIDGFGMDKFFETLVACHKNEIVGYPSFHKGYDIQSASREIYLIDLFVMEEYRGQALGTALLNAVGNRCMKIKSKWISWHVAQANTKAIRYYEKIGAQRSHSFQYVVEVDSVFPA